MKASFLKYFFPVIETDVNRSMDFDKNRSMCVVRTISDVKQWLDSDKIDRFLDIVPNTNFLQNQAYNQIQSLETKMMDKEYKHNYTVKWDEPTGINKKSHADYLEQMGQDVFKQMKLLIDSAMEEYVTNVDTIEDFLYEENLFHWQQARTNIAGMVGRISELNYIQQYVLDVTSHPLIIHGESGIGKSVLLSMASTMVSLLLTYSDTDHWFDSVKFLFNFHSFHFFSILIQHN